MTYWIMYKHPNGEVEAIDSTETQDGADYLLKEYALAFGNVGRLWIEEEKTA